MFYGQCWKCGERWGLGTAPTCICPDEALAEQPAQQEPVAIERLMRGQAILQWNRAQAEPPITVTKELWVAEQLEQFYIRPQAREWVGLTDEEQTQVAWSCGAMSADWLDFARAIEAKLKEKNTHEDRN